MSGKAKGHTGFLAKDRGKDGFYMWTRGNLEVKRNLGFYLEDLREIQMHVEEGPMEFRGVVGNAQKKLWGRPVASGGFTVEAQRGIWGSVQEARGEP